MTAFWLDFQGLGPPRMLKMSKTGLLEKHRFLGFRKLGSEAGFRVFEVFLGSVLELLGDPKSQKEFSVYVSLSGVSPGSFFDNFRAHFCVILVLFVVSRSRFFVIFLSFVFRWSSPGAFWFSVGSLCFYSP